MSKKDNLLQQMFEVLYIPNILTTQSDNDGMTEEINVFMKEVKLYANTNKMQRNDSSEALKEYNSRIQWKKENAKILDMGCGDGGVTVQVLKPYLPRNFKKLIGCDISKDMVAHANLHYKDDKTEFTVLDIEGDTTQFVRQFDHIFSFYALHWIQNQEKAFSNVYSMLVRGGDCLLQFICHQPVFDVYRIMANSSTWSQHMSDVEKFIPPYQDSQNPEEELKNIMSKCGFKKVEVHCEDKVFNYESFEAMKNALRSVNPFVHRLPPALAERFIDDFLVEVLQIDGYSKISDNNGGHKIKCCYSLLVAYGSK